MEVYKASNTSFFPCFPQLLSFLPPFLLYFLSFCLSVVLSFFYPPFTPAFLPFFPSVSSLHDLWWHSNQTLPLFSIFCRTSASQFPGQWWMQYDFWSCHCMEIVFKPSYPVYICHWQAIYFGTGPEITSFMDKLCWKTMNNGRRGNFIIALLSKNIKYISIWKFIYVMCACAYMYVYIHT